MKYLLCGFGNMETSMILSSIVELVTFMVNIVKFTGLGSVKLLDLDYFYIIPLYKSYVLLWDRTIET